MNIRRYTRVFLTASLLLISFGQTALCPADEPLKDPERMGWWRQARFGMFIHWGLYAIPAGQWQGNTNHAEWIRTTAQIPLETYDQFVDQFNPVKFDADEWARMAKDAGMKYIVITSKHHDGFCLFDSAHTDFDIMSTPFKRDIMKELSGACRKHGLQICWYHSIMDWHHPDYLPRRGWEKEHRPVGDADFNRFIKYLHGQVTELLTKYGPIGVMWFDGEWEDTWSHEYGQPLYDLCRSIQPNVIINNRVDKGRAGMAGMTTDQRFAGDFGTPEQEIPATGLPGVDWETCMTMNRHWGYNAHDKDFKSTADLVHKLADIASKGGNFLLNIGPKADGTFPQESIDRLREIGAWMKINGDAIYGTSASPFKTLPWGRCTQKQLNDGNTRLYLHVFDWPVDSQLILPELDNHLTRAYLLAYEKPDQHGTLRFSRRPGAVTIQLPPKTPDPINSVVVLDIQGSPQIINPPEIHAVHDIFVDAIQVQITPCCENVAVHYTIDGSDPTLESYRAPQTLILSETAQIRAGQFRNGHPLGGISQRTFTKVTPRPAAEIVTNSSGLQYEYYEGEWNQLPDFDQLTPVKRGTIDNFSFSPRQRSERFGFRYLGLIEIQHTGVYTFYTLSDDGSRLYIDEQLVVDNDGLHGAEEASGLIPLAASLHHITVTYFEKTGGDSLEVWFEGPKTKKQRIPTALLWHE
ncbi:MAG: alpha-L-fucosidase [Planctomycetota bacterium]